MLSSSSDARGRGLSVCYPRARRACAENRYLGGRWLVELECDPLMFPRERDRDDTRYVRLRGCPDSLCPVVVEMCVVVVQIVV